MASSRDVRDMLGLAVGGEAQKAAVQKRPKPAAPQRKFQGVAREVAALYGERPPPVAVYEEKKSYRAKRQNAGPAKKWIQQPFTNPARSDGLILKHWRRKPTNVQTNGEDTPMEDGGETTEPVVDSNYEFAKFNIQIEIPQFTDEEYDAYLRNDNWTREETDYLLSLIRDYYYRWPVIHDRYDYQPSTNPQPQNGMQDPDSNALSALPFAPPPTKTRTVEDLKARFYDLSAKLMRLRIPEVQMDADQYHRYEILTKFNPDLERNRKALAIALMSRNVDEVKEEEFLLAELQRINMAASRLDAERQELRSRLEAPMQNPNAAPQIQSFQSSQALHALFQQLFQQDRSKKRASGTSGNGPARLSLSATDIINAPGSATSHSGGGALNSASSARRGTLPNTASSQNPPPPTPIRTLSPQTAHRFNVSTHDRLTSGVSFGSDKLLKMRQAKSNVQTQKIAAALANLGIADLIAIPTSRVGEAFEKLVGKVGKLLDVRKVREKEEAEIKVLEAMRVKRFGEGKKDGGSGSTGKDGKDGDAAAKSSTATATQQDNDKKQQQQQASETPASASPADKKKRPATSSSRPSTANSSSLANANANREIPDTPQEHETQTPQGEAEAEAEAEEDDEDDGNGKTPDADGEEEEEEEEEEDADGEADVDAEGEELDDQEGEEEEEEEGEEDADGEEVAETPGGLRAEANNNKAAGHKRSASVLSQASHQSMKRARK